MAVKTWLSAERLASLGNTTRQNWHLGVTAFGGPPVHFKIVSDCPVMLTPGSWGWEGERD